MLRFSEQWISHEIIFCNFILQLFIYRNFFLLIEMLQESKVLVNNNSARYTIK
jgi:hypothetical protein